MSQVRDTRGAGPSTRNERLDSLLASAAKTLPEDARRANRSLLLRALHHGGPASRAELAKLVGLTPATVSSLMKDLLAADIVEELGRTSGSVGKPATMLGIEPDGRHIVALGLSEPDRFVGAIVNLTGKVIARTSAPRDDRTGDAAVELLAAMCDELIEAAERPVLGIGVASPGIVDQAGTVLRAARLDWRSVPLAAQLTRRTGHPVHVANDANAAALAALTFGRGESTNLLFVRVDQGVGAGLVLDGNLFRGSFSAAGEIGHVVVDPDGALCTCGKHGCLETEIAAPALAQLLRDAGPTAEVDVLRRAGERLGDALAAVVSALDVTDIILSGPDPIVSETFRAAAARAIATRTMPEIGGRLTVRPSGFGDDDVVLGAAALVLDVELGIR